MEALAEQSSRTDQEPDAALARFDFFCRTSRAGNDLAVVNLHSGGRVPAVIDFAANNEGLSRWSA